MNNNSKNRKEKIQRPRSPLFWRTDKKKNDLIIKEEEKEIEVEKEKEKEKDKVINQTREKSNFPTSDHHRKLRKRKKEKVDEKRLKTPLKAKKAKTTKFQKDNYLNEKENVNVTPESKIPEFKTFSNGSRTEPGKRKHRVRSTSIRKRKVKTGPSKRKKHFSDSKDASESFDSKFFINPNLPINLLDKFNQIQKKQNNRNKKKSKHNRRRKKENRREKKEKEKERERKNTNKNKKISKKSYPISNEILKTPKQSITKRSAQQFFLIEEKKDNPQNEYNNSIDQDLIIDSILINKFGKERFTNAQNSGWKRSRKRKKHTKSYSEKKRNNTRIKKNSRILHNSKYPRTIQHDRNRRRKNYQLPKQKKISNVINWQEQNSNKYNNTKEIKRKNENKRQQEIYNKRDDQEKKKQALKSKDKKQNSIFRKIGKFTTIFFSKTKN
ncbi:hypothetical protein M0813_22089 [Anaeramoeba flamelloides]|uniref:Uncharacterized protein n=1 Tax=Anaeramoeba flamelloides TaxID=1746091 RepID=A0ABQ8YGC7_9EUKA|nr:hypothetical protein M0813_22089 [Anaeramoeba flamelloides]